MLKNSALTVEYYNYSDFHAWVKNTIFNNTIDAVVIFSSVMAQYIDKNLYSRMLVDFVDVDSQKWSEYAKTCSWPLSWLYRREGECLLQYERSLALKAKHSFFVTDKERNLFSLLAPESVLKTSALNNGVDSDFFSQNENFKYPFFDVKDNRVIAVVFTGAMDYWPNIDAVVWFLENVFNVLIERNKNYRFYIVGRDPSQKVLNLNSENVFVTGTVEDVRPYLQHAAVVVAPLRIARGIQNKILEAMSMSKPVVASQECVSAIDTTDGLDILSAESAEDFIYKIQLLVEKQCNAESIGRSARLNVLEKYSWTSHLKKIDAHIN